MKKCLIMVLLVLLCTSMTMAKETILVPATDNDMVWGFMNELEPIDNNWVFVSDGLTLTLNGLQYDPPLRLAEKRQVGSVTSEMRAESLKRRALTDAADVAFTSSGCDAAVQVLGNSELVVNVKKLSEHQIEVLWKGFPGPVIMNFAKTEVVLDEDAPGQSSQPVKYTAQKHHMLRIEEFTKNLREGRGVAFGTGYIFTIPEQKCEGFAQFVKKLNENGEKSLTEVDWRNVPAHHAGFLHDARRGR